MMPTHILKGGTYEYLKEFKTLAHGSSTI
jgi:hypothetical protein